LGNCCERAERTVVANLFWIWRPLKARPRRTVDPNFDRRHVVGLRTNSGAHSLRYECTAKKLMRLALQIPIDWAEQRKLLGFR
jgi:hypothetical protein